MHAAHDAQTATHEMAMQSSIDLTDPMSRESSGTAWVPDSTPIYGKMFMLGRGHAHAAWRRCFRDTSMPAPGGATIGSMRLTGSWECIRIRLGDDAQLGARLMMSLDPLTEGGRGYPLFFQTGETWHDQPLHDRQHPHDLFDELSVELFAKSLPTILRLLYFGYPGEPALGPPTFMHRLSAMDNPDAPISASLAGFNAYHIRRRNPGSGLEKH